MREMATVCGLLVRICDDFDPNLCEPQEREDCKRVHDSVFAAAGDVLAVLMTQFDQDRSVALDFVRSAMAHYDDIKAGQDDEDDEDDETYCVNDDE